MARRVLLTHTVTTTVVLANGRIKRYSWTTPVSFGRLLGKGGAWAREALREERVPGRSQIVSMHVEIVRGTEPWTSEE